MEFVFSDPKIHYFEQWAYDLWPFYYFPRYYFDLALVILAGLFFLWLFYEWTKDFKNWLNKKIAKIRKKYFQKTSGKSEG